MGAGYAVWSGDTRGFRPVGRGLSSDIHGMALTTTGGARGLLVMGSMGTGAYVSAYSSTSPTRGGYAYGPWRRLGQGPGDGVVTALLVLPGPHPTLLAGTGAGIYRLHLS